LVRQNGRREFGGECNNIGGVILLLVVTAQRYTRTVVILRFIGSFVPQRNAEIWKFNSKIKLVASQIFHGVTAPDLDLAVP
jgi:hypothetical protein